MYRCNVCIKLSFVHNQCIIGAPNGMVNPVSYTGYMLVTLSLFFFCFTSETVHITLLDKRKGVN